MKEKKALIISIIILAFVVVAIMVGIKINSKNRELGERQENIESTYKELEINIKDYNGNREMISSKLDNYYTDNLESDYDDFIKILNEQENIIDRIKLSTKDLGKNCGDRLYPRGDINKICNNYQDYYETVVNVFVSDFSEINTIINDYNQANNKELEVYKAKNLVDYVDYNKDGKYLGRDQYEEG